MKKLHFLFAAIAVLLFSCMAVSAQKKPASPNVIIIFMDDMGLGDIGCYGAMDYTTPNIDRLAAQGMRFTNFEAAQPTCTASRAALLTGCYPNRIGMYGAFNPHDTIGLASSETTIAEMLKQKGYHTAMVGKWHLGNQPRFLPTTQGFDEYLGLPYSNDMWPVDFDGVPVKAGTKKALYPPLPLLSIRAGQNIPDTAKIIATLADQGLLTQTYLNRALQFINKNAKSPFFLYIANSMTHVPIMASPKFKGASGAGLFGDVVEEVDWSVGQIMATLKRLKLEDNTIVIFTADNGPWLNFGNHAGSTTGLREGKGTSWEGGTHVPAIVRWPAKVPAGVVSNTFASNIDILPTLAALTGAPLPAKKIDGINMLPALLQKEAKGPSQRVFFYYYNKNDLEAVRKGHWKLALPHTYRSYEGVLPGMNGQAGPYSKGVQKDIALFDLSKDPGERYDIKSIYPDIVKELLTLADDARKDMGDDLTNSRGSGRRLH